METGLEQNVQTRRYKYNARHILRPSGAHLRPRAGARQAPPDNELPLPCRSGATLPNGDGVGTTSPDLAELRGELQLLIPARRPARVEKRNGASRRWAEARPLLQPDRKVVVDVPDVSPQLVPAAFRFMRLVERMSRAYRDASS